MRRSGDEGNAIVEFALWVPMTVAALATCLQLVLMIHDERAATEAARLALRAQEAGEDPEAVVREVLSEQATVTAQGGTVTVRLPVRKFLPWLPGPFTTAEGSAS